MVFRSTNMTLTAVNTGDILSNIENLLQFYHGKAGESLFEVWERGDARGDSITPSTYSDSYRIYILGELRRLLGAPGAGTLLSLGCGNATVEAELVANGYDVLAVDALEEAVRLASKKGVTAVKVDVESWIPTSKWDVIYADGLFGHLYDPNGGLQPILTRIRSWLTPDRGTLVVSNDAPRDSNCDAKPAPGVPDFHWLSTALIESEARKAGFARVSTSSFVYDRPISGPRSRAIVIAA